MPFTREQLARIAANIQAATGRVLSPQEIEAFYGKPDSAVLRSTPTPVMSAGPASPTEISTRTMPPPSRPSRFPKATPGLEVYDDDGSPAARAVGISQFGTLTGPERASLRDIATALSPSGLLTGISLGAPIDLQLALDAIVQGIFGPQPQGFVSTVTAADLRDYGLRDPIGYGNLAGSIGLSPKASPETVAGRLNDMAAKRSEPGPPSEPEPPMGEFGPPPGEPEPPGEPMSEFGAPSEPSPDPSGWAGGIMGGALGPDAAGQGGDLGPGTGPSGETSASAEGGMGSMGGGLSGGGEAKGGVKRASKPTRVTFGEAGPETAIFIPHNIRKIPRDRKAEMAQELADALAKLVPSDDHIASLIAQARRFIAEGEEA